MRPSIGNLGGWASPYAVGFLRNQTQSMVPALLALCGVELLTAMMIFWVAWEKAQSR
jgi:nitrate/nitrite transporter NarK